MNPHAGIFIQEHFVPYKHGFNAFLNTNISEKVCTFLFFLANSILQKSVVQCNITFQYFYSRDVCLCIKTLYFIMIMKQRSDLGYITGECILFNSKNRCI